MRAKFLFGVCLSLNRLTQTMAQEVSQQKIDALNSFLDTFKLRDKTRSGIYTFYINDIPVGMVRTSECAILGPNALGKFRIHRGQREIHLSCYNSPEAITYDFAKMLDVLKSRDQFICLRGWRNELVDVHLKFGEQPMFKIERAATSLFGLKRYGVHINGFVRNGGAIESVWLQRRSNTKEQFPGLLDIIVSGGLEAGKTPQEAVFKECSEEASITAYLCEKHVKPVGTVSFVYEDELGVHPLTFFCYDADLPADFEPKVNDGEVQEFVRYPMSELLDLITDPKRFKATSAPTVLDFLIRHHVIDSTYGTALMKTTMMIHQNLQDQYPYTQH